MRDTPISRSVLVLFLCLLHRTIPTMIAMTTPIMGRVTAREIWTTRLMRIPLSSLEEFAGGGEAVVGAGGLLVNVDGILLIVVAGVGLLVEFEMERVSVPVPGLTTVHGIPVVVGLSTVGMFSSDVEVGFDVESGVELVLEVFVEFGN